MRFRTKDPFVLLAVVERQSQHIRFFRHLFRSPSSLSPSSLSAPGRPVGRKTEVSSQLHSCAIGVESFFRRDSVPDLFMSQTRTTVLYKVVPLTSLSAVHTLIDFLFLSLLKNNRNGPRPHRCSIFRTADFSQQQ
jgi:hypothetical protein